MKKIISTGICFLIFVVSIDVYLYANANYKCDIAYLGAWYTLSSSFMVISLWVIESNKVDTFLQKSIIDGAKLSLMLLWGDVFLTKIGVIKSPYIFLFIFMAGSGTALLILLYQFSNTLTLKWKIVLLLSFIVFFGLLRVLAGLLILK